MRRKSLWAMVLAVGLTFLVTSVSGVAAAPKVLGEATKESYSNTSKKISSNPKAISKKKKNR